MMLIPIYLAASLVVIGENGKEVRREAVLINGKEAMKKCVDEFIACSLPDILHASEHKNNEALCKLFPDVIDCMARALSDYCQNSRRQPRVKLLYMELNKMERQYFSSKCNISNNGSFLVPSILLICFVSILSYSQC